MVSSIAGFLGKYQSLVFPHLLWSEVTDSPGRRIVVKGQWLDPRRLLFALLLIPLPGPTHAGGADITDAHISCDHLRRCDFRVTVQHEDGDFHHAPVFWRVLDEQQNVLAIQDIPRPGHGGFGDALELKAVLIPENVEVVTLQAQDSRHGFTGRVFRLHLTIPPSGTTPGGP